jgi:hypothetical protein
MTVQPKLFVIHLLLMVGVLMIDGLMIFIQVITSTTTTATATATLEMKDMELEDKAIKQELEPLETEEVEEEEDVDDNDDGSNNSFIFTILFVKPIKKK